MAVVIQFTPNQPELRSSQEEELLIAFRKISDLEIRSSVCELIKAIVREQPETKAADE